MADVEESRFVVAAGGIGALGCLVAAATPLVAGSGVAFRGSIVASALVGLVFAVQNLRVVRAGGPRLAPAAITAVFGVWFMVAPLLYDAGFLPTAGTQFAGLLVASFAGYLALSAVE